MIIRRLLIVSYFLHTPFVVVLSSQDTCLQLCSFILVKRRSSSMMWSQ